MVLKASDIYGVPAELMVIKTKNRPACLAREMVWYVCYEHHQLAYQCIADYFAGRAHSSVRRGIEMIKGEIQVNKERQQQLNLMMAGL